MRYAAPDNHKAGFWVRYAALCIDLLIVRTAVRWVIAMFNRAGIYVPFELTLGASFLVYSVVLTGWRAATIGKMLCGLTVRPSTGNSAGYLRISLRETIGKLLSALFLFVGFIWPAFSPKKLAWHDYLAHTTVVQDSKAHKRARIVLCSLIVLTASYVVTKASRAAHLYADIRKVALPPNVTMPYENRDPSALVEIASLNTEDYTQFIEWLKFNGKDPLEYAVDTASRHQVTIFGEIHEIKDYLLFLNRIIPELYRRAGVTAVAMEVCLARDNEKIRQLVTAPQFDRRLALQIARHQPWGLWGHKEYWDVFETVWRLNRNLPDGSKKMRVVGISTECDFPSIALLTGAADGKLKTPIWEKLRIFRVPDDIIVELMRDRLMARIIESQIIDKGERAIVWIGLNHSYTHYQQPIISKGKLVKKWSRMGVLLHQKYGDRIFQVALHQTPFDSVMKNFVEPLMKKGDNVPVAFDVADSPFANLRDSRSDQYRFQPKLAFADKAAGYIYLRPFRQLQKCTWLDEYISRQMFVINKPYYQAWARLAERKVNNAQEANETLKFIFERP